MTSRKSEQEGERIAKRIARAGLCSRREAEQWIFAGRVEVNGKPIASLAVNVSAADRIKVDGKPLPERERTRLFLYHKPRGLVTSARDPEGRPTLFERLPKHLPRLVSIGRLDLNSEGLLLLTNDGGLPRGVEIPETGWLRGDRGGARGPVAPNPRHGPPPRAPVGRRPLGASEGGRAPEAAGKRARGWARGTRGGRRNIGRDITDESRARVSAASRDVISRICNGFFSGAQGAPEAPLPLRERVARRAERSRAG